MKITRLLLSLLSLLLVGGCTQAEFLAVNAPTWLDGTATQKNIVYDKSSGQALDIYLPKKASQNKKYPVIVFFYGGRWTTGERADYRFVGSALAKKGFIVVIPDYRKYPDVRFPVFVEDGARAVAWTYHHIAEYGGDPDQLYVTGHSSGAHIGALVSADERYLAAQGLKRSIIKGFAGLAGPYAFTPDTPDLIDIFGPPEKYPEMQVPRFIDGQQPPMFLLYGDADKVVGKVNIKRLAAAIRKKGGCSKIKIYPGIDHAGIVASLSWIGTDRENIAGDILEFFGNPCGSGLPGKFSKERG